MKPFNLEIKQKEDMEEKKPTNLDKNDEFGNVYTVYKHISPNGKEYFNITEASKENAILPTSISNCIHGRSKSAGGFIWKLK